MAKFKMSWVPPEEIQAGFSILEPGEGTFTVKNIFYKDKDGFELKTAEGLPKIIVVIQATDSKGAESSIYEHISPKATFKTYTMCKAVGRKELYEEDGTDFDKLKGLSGKCVLKVEQTPGYNATTKIGSYIPHPMYKDEKEEKSKTNYSANMPDDSLGDMGKSLTLEEAPF